ncbi:carbohydrate ABC transporter permease [Rhizobium brockwellii]|uniref:Sugar ABC transporter permease n=2 Tax=Rhizobium TaxID=379 RepID=A0ABU3YEG5_9HYPH|nr:MULTISPECIES: sugar ABC transporter permease [Rhizobium]MDV4177255.1 sugar ABC transporter permease [Rhizobium brockwellii]MDV4184254.1 sugar ABC transporter permease [Rhizobium brockwellii]QIO50953.1 sugar ABC transporter permease [Rhizobium leguminosarum bv. trifolii]TAV74607.1 sugar ABC transporter permease [Rhizobium leguminosarum]TAV79206.1 sugar ABC transporter permease [Rhizobium leguminosarum]
MTSTLIVNEQTMPGKRPASRGLGRSLGLAAWPYLLMVPTVALLVAFTLYPLVQGLLMAFFRRGVVVLDQMPNTWPQYVGFQNFTGLIQDADFRTSLVKTVVFVVVAVPLNISVSLALALLLSPQTKFFAFVRTIVFFPSMISLLIIGVAWRWLFGLNNGLVNYLLSLMHIAPVAWLEQDTMAQIAVVIAWIWAQAGFNMMIFIAGLTAISPDYYEAASIDRTTKWRQFTHITLPLLKPTMAVVLVLSSIEAFKVYELVVSLTGGGPGKATVYLIQTIYDTAFQKPMQAGVAAAQSMVLFVILLLLTVFQLRVSRGEK